MPTIRRPFTSIHRLFTSALLALLLIVATTGSFGQVEASSSGVSKSEDSNTAALTPQQKMQKRFPQPVRVGFLVGLPVLDDDDNTLGYVQRVVRTSEGRIQLIVRYGGWFGWIGWWQRHVAVPVEVVAMLGPFVAAIDMHPDEFRKAPTWTMADGTADIPADEIIRVALTKR
jgi:hypothetical protein